MNPEVKKRWVEALRSGEYEQGYGGLQVAGKYCCLGVLCDLAARDGVVEKATNYCNACQMDHESFASAEVYPPSQVREWAGLESANPVLPGRAVSAFDTYVGSQSLATLNDSGKYPFERIADLIEEYL
jgi:hypothetical protein